MTSNTNPSVDDEKEIQSASEVIGRNNEIYPMIDHLQEEGKSWSDIYTAITDAAEAIEEKQQNKDNITSPTDVVPVDNLVFDFIHDMRIDENSWNTIFEHLKKTKESITENVDPKPTNEDRTVPDHESTEKGPQDRRYICTSCNSIVRARWRCPGSFTIGCECTTVPIVPQMGQNETPDKWRVERPECCQGVNVNTLDVIYGERGKDYKCPDCGAEYFHDGKMVGAPTRKTQEVD